MENGQVFGLKCGELLAEYDQDSQSWKTLQRSLFEDSTECLDRFPKSGTMRNGKLYEQATWVRRTGEKESGLWPTPCRPGNGGSNGKAKLKKMLWPTPSTEDHKSDGPKVMARMGTKEMKTCDQRLRNFVKMSDGNKNIPDERINAQFVEWMMGYKKDWTDLKADNLQDHQGWIEDESTPRITEGQEKRAARLKCLGNSIVPQIAGLLFDLIKDKI